MADFPLIEGHRLETAGFPALSNMTGTYCTDGAANVKGAWEEYIASTTFNATQLIFVQTYYGTTASFLLDVGIGSAGSEVVLIPDIHVSAVYGRNSWVYIFPVTVPAGSRLAVRGQDSVGSDNPYSYLILSAQGFAPSQPLGRVTAYGINTATSRGTQIDPGGSSYTKGAWVQIDAAIANPIKIMTIGIGSIANATMTTARWRVDIGIGPNGSEIVVIPDLFLCANTTTDIIVPSTFPPLAVDIPSGVRLVARAACSITDATDRKFDVAIYGID